MGGLICRTVLQRELDDPESVVSKLVTIGTPHGGIDPKLGGGIGDWIIEKFGPNGSDIFSPERMKQYMLPKDYDPKDDVDRRTKEWDPRRMVGSFPVRRILSIVGTNARDYEVALGLSAKAMGEQSDGLVAFRNAYVWGSARAFVHRAHSGRYGLVNSEEAYQNLRRFLFGTLRVDLGLHGLDLDDERVWQADARLAIRGLPVLMHEQTAEHHCPVDLNAEARQRATPTAPVPLVTTFLLPRDKPPPQCRYALHLKVTSLDERGGIFGFGDHLEQIADWEDSLIVDVTVDEKGEATDVHWQWNSEVAGRIAEKVTLDNRLEWDPENRDDPAKGWAPSIPLPLIATRLLGAEARLALTISRWD
jgi:hypothetical protein